MTLIIELAMAERENLVLLEGRLQVQGQTIRTVSGKETNVVNHRNLAVVGTREPP